MSKKAFEAIEQGLREAIEYGKGNTAGARAHEVEVPDVASARKRLNLTQREFSKVFALPLSTIRNWEQGARTPEGPARVLLKVIEQEPRAVMRALRMPPKPAKKVNRKRAAG
jgi:putative transcriptional regulator